MCHEPFRGGAAPVAPAVEKLCLLLVAGALLALSPLGASAQPARPGRLNPAHLGEMPLVETVRREITAPDPADRAARQMGAFAQLQEIVEELSSGRTAVGNGTPDETAVLQEYRDAYFAVQGAALENASDMDEVRRLRRFDEDPAIREELLGKFFSPGLQAQSRELSRVLMARRAQMRARGDAFGETRPPEPAPRPDLYKMDENDGPAYFIELARQHGYWRWGVTLAGMFAAIFVLALLGVGTRSRRGEGRGPQLPDGLRSVGVVGARYSLQTFSGVVASEKTTTTTEAETTVTVGGTYSYGHLPWSATTTVRTTERQLVFVRYAPGEEGAWEFTNAKLAVASGHVLTLVARGTKRALDCLLAYNHTTSTLRCFSLYGSHQVAGFAPWLAAIAVGVAGLAWSMKAMWAVVLADPRVPPEWSELGDPALRPWWLLTYLIISAIVALVPYCVSQLVIVGVRNAVFRMTYLPRIRAELASWTPRLQPKSAA